MKITIRDLLWLIVVCAIAGYTYMDHLAHQKLKARIATVEDDWKEEKAWFEKNAAG
jgi:hypothetical protein